MKLRKSKSTRKRSLTLTTLCTAPSVVVTEASSDAEYILEGEEFDWKWLRVDVPVELLVKPNLLEWMLRNGSGTSFRSETERFEKIRMWMRGNGGARKALEGHPVLVEVTDTKPVSIRLLDGAHRSTMAQEQGLDRVPTLVGIDSEVLKRACSRRTRR